jgi:catechol 2,3-dioxygenase-like lactoylglutathione lyase family enzyme
MKRYLGLVTLVVRDYDEAIDFFVGKLDFRLVEDTPVPEQSKRWVVVSPPGAGETMMLLARAAAPEQSAHIGNQTGGRVAFFLCTDDFDRDYAAFRARGVKFIRPAASHAYGRVAVFLDLYGNAWDLLEPSGRDACSVNRHRYAPPRGGGPETP